MVFMPTSLQRVFMNLLSVGFLSLAGCSSIPEPGASELPKPVSLRVATWNIKHGLGMDGQLDLERIAATIETFDADIVALQEVDENVEKIGNGRLALLAEARIEAELDSALASSAPAATSSTSATSAGEA